MKKFTFIYKTIILLVLLLPLVNYPPFFAPPAFAKSMVFRILFSLLFFLSTYFCFFHKSSDLFKKIVKRIKAKKNTLFYIPIILLGVLVISTIFSKDILFSIFGDPERGGGLLTFASIILFSYLLIFLLDKEEWKNVWNVSFLAGTAVAIFGVIQWLGIFERVIQSTRPFSTMGNPTVLALYLLLLLFPVIAFFVKEKNKTVKWIYFSTAILFTFVILLTYTRASLLGMFIGFVYLFLFYPKKGKIIFSLRIAMLVVTILVSSFLYFSNVETKPRIIEENKVLSGLSNRLTVDRAVRDPRVGGFLIGWEAIKEKPLLGYGPENFAIAFNKHYHPDMPHIGRDIPWWDKAHNLLIEMWIWGGVLAALSVLLLFGFLFKSLHKDRKENPENHVLQAGIIAFFTASMFTIDTFSVYLLFFILCGYVISLSLKEVSLHKKDEKVLFERRELFSRYGTVFLVICTPLFLVFLYGFNAAPLFANRDINMANSYHRAEDCEKALESLERATENSTVIDSYLYRYKALVSEKCLERNRETTLRIYEYLKKITETRPLHVQSLNNLSAFILSALPYAEKEEKMEMVKEAQEITEKIKEISPNRFQIYLRLAEIKIFYSDYEKAYENANICLSLSNDKDCFFFRGLASAALRKEGIQEDMRESEERGFNLRSEDLLNMLINAYAKAENYDAIIPLYKILIEDHPENLQYYSSIAATFKEAGNYDKAREYAMKIVEIDPSMRIPVEEFLKTLPN